MVLRSSKRQMCHLAPFLILMPPCVPCPRLPCPALLGPCSLPPCSLSLPLAPCLLFLALAPCCSALAPRFLPLAPCSLPKRSPCPPPLAPCSLPLAPCSLLKHALLVHMPPAKRMHRLSIHQDRVWHLACQADRGRAWQNPCSSSGSSFYLRHNNSPCSEEHWRPPPIKHNSSPGSKQPLQQPVSKAGQQFLPVLTFGE